MTTSEKVAYLKGLTTGLKMNLSDTNEGKVLASIIDILEDLSRESAKGLSRIDALAEECDDLNDRLDEVDEALTDSVSAGVAPDIDDPEVDVYYTTCPTCGRDVELTAEMLDSGEAACPYCGEIMNFDFDDITEDDAPDAPQEDSDGALTDVLCCNCGNSFCVEASFLEDVGEVYCPYCGRVIDVSGEDCAVTDETDPEDAPTGE